MKRLFTLAAIAAVCSGCTYVKSPTGWSYWSVGFQKTIADMSVSTNGTLALKGYQSKDSQIAAGVAEGIVRGMAKGANPLP